MTHVIVKLQSGRTEQQKDVEPSDWTETVYKPDILGKSHTIYKTPGYNPL